MNKALKDKDRAIQKAENFIRDCQDTAPLEKERDELREQLGEIVKVISDNATAVYDRIQYKVENEELYKRHGELNSRYEAVLEELKQKKADAMSGQEFLRYFREMTGPIKDFNELYWYKLLDKIVVDKGKKLTVIFTGGYSVRT